MNKKQSFNQLTIFIFLLTLLVNGCVQQPNNVQNSNALIVAPIDVQKIQDQDEMTWADYNAIPGKNWANPQLKPTTREMKIALIAIDFRDQPFVITLPKHSDAFGNPQIEPIKREEVPQFYADFYNTPNDVNHGHTINGYWMEQSRGKVGISKIEAFGPYKMPKNLWEYGCNEWGQHNSTPTGEKATGRMERDCDSIWLKNEGDIKKNYDVILRMYAGYDETGIWQEFGEMKFKSKDDIPPEWGNPNPDKPRWIETRYVDWTSWKAGAQQWGISSLRQGENSGTITHEIGHYLFRTGDNNNNPYVQPYRRAGSGTWDMMDRGSFNGPEGPHSRWKVPAVAGASMPGSLMLRQKLNFEFVTEDQVLKLNRDGLAKSGLVVAKVTAREIEPLPNTFAGIVVNLDGISPQDRTPEVDPATNPLSSGVANFNFYSLEVIQRMGYDSYAPDNGVLIAKNRERESNNEGPNGFNCFNWVIDAHPEDINIVDYFHPGDGKPVMRTIADYRQLNDALFHAGLNSGSKFEWEDPYNSLHFYIIDLQRDENNILSYTLGVRSLDGSGPQKRGVSISSSEEIEKLDGMIKCNFNIINTGKAIETDTALHPQDVTQYLNYDIYRLSASIKGKGWSVQLLNELIEIKFGNDKKIPVYITNIHDSDSKAIITLTAVSESDPTKIAINEFTLNK